MGCLQAVITVNGCKMCTGICVITIKS